MTTVVDIVTAVARYACAVGLLATSAHLITWARQLKQADRARCTHPHCRTCQILARKDRP